MNVPFRHYNDKNIRWIDRTADQAFRRALMVGVPPSLRGKMHRALAAVPNPAKDLAHSQRYFGAELPAIAARARAVVEQLDAYLHDTLNLPGLCEWLRMTGYDNHYEMVKVFNEWAQMKRD